MHELRKMLCMELDKITKRGEIATPQTLEIIDKLTHSIKSIDTILAMQEAGYSNDYMRSDHSYARHRDSMGRYADDMDMDDYRYMRGSR